MARRAGVILCGGLLALAGCLLPQALPATPADRAAIVTIEDFADWLDAASITLTPETQSLAKRRIAASTELRYDYRGSGGGGDEDPIDVVLHAELTVHPNAISARHNARSYAIGLAAGLERGGASFEPVDTALEWEDDFTFYAIRRGEQQIGNGFVGRRGNVASYVVISGLYSSDPALFELALAPKLRALDGYDPSPPDGLAALD